MYSESIFSQPQPMTGAVRTTLKWFNTTKGFGFVIPENKNQDVFLHISVLQRAGIDSLGEGASLLCRIEPGAKGSHVREVVQVLREGATPKSVRSNTRNGAEDFSDTTRITGTVKWYKPEKGYGFVKADDGECDVFLHKKTLERYNLDSIEPRTPVAMLVKATPRGRKAVDFEFLE
ncbi:MAG TPA: cold shock domain-containing protein [Patescibacteria group bacterium]|nr:cold shock domain-containing protein [Patescibacteria group bacterium]